MLKQRVIFALLWNRGSFCLSRNFSLQEVGDLGWLLGQYRLDTLLSGVDELMVVDVSRGERQGTAFAHDVMRIAREFPLPLTVGGGIMNEEQVHDALRSGADKVLVHAALESPEKVVLIGDTFGRQCLVGCIDYREESSQRIVYAVDGAQRKTVLTKEYISLAAGLCGEVLLHSITRDGTGQGLDLEAGSLASTNSGPIILMGGAGTPHHLVEALAIPEVSAVSTANLLNFVGNGFQLVRDSCAEAGVILPQQLPSLASALRSSSASTSSAT